MSKKAKGTEDTLRKEWQKPKEQGYGPSAPQYPKGADPSKPGYSTRQTNLGASQHLAKGAWTQKEREQAIARRHKEETGSVTGAKGAWTKKEKEAAMTRKREAAQAAKGTTAKGAWTQKEKEAAMRRKKEAAMAAKNKR